MSVRGITIVVHRDGDVESRSVRLPVWFVRTVVFLSGAFVVMAAVGGVLYTPIARRAAQVAGLSRELGELRAKNARVVELAQNLEAAEQSYQQLRTMLGGDIVPSRPRPDSAPAVAYPIFAAPPSTERIRRSMLLAPARWPLDEPGIVTRATVRGDNGGEEHTGLDVAVPIGTPIRAAGTGVVLEAAEHAEYGLFVRIAHGNDFESMYGHASRLLVSAGDSVEVGQVIALSGSTGRSTAPHLHYEIFRGGRSIDPRTLLSQEP